MSVCRKCGHDVQIGQWFDCPHGWVTRQPATVHPRERSVKYYHPQYGYRTPGRADQPMPDRLKQLGFTAVDFPTLSDLRQHAKTAGSRAEVLDFDANSTKADEHYG